MPSLELIDHSPRHPDPSPPIPTASNVILIDNYDSFTWNVYQYLVFEGANVTVYRNDELSLEELVAKNPTQLVISPGPGHPAKDAGISNDAIKHFSGKIPILGVCMGAQCMYYSFGGTVDVTGQILHGKTSPLKHDGKGIYVGVAQQVPVTRYHSLAGTGGTLPDCLEVTSTIPANPEADVNEVIMGVRHKEYVIEGVQFHPESILTQYGRVMMRNFLRMQGGTWAENERLSKEAHEQAIGATTNGSTNGATEDKKTSILDKIYNHRRAAVAEQKKIPSQRPSDLQASYDLNLAPPQIDFPARLRQSPYRLSLMAEIKRASPSKGIISLSTCAPAQARKYAKAGASAISVLTEPEWFKGSIDDLRAVRQSLEGMPNRPAVLRKEFIFDEYQILEARLAGADTVLLIVKMLDEAVLKQLYDYSRSLGMEPLVEVQNVEEMEIAVKLGSKVIGVNNRNLVSFEVDLETTNRLVSMVAKETILCALSGIAGSKDVEPYIQSGVGAVLVGEALMRASNTEQFIAELLGGSSAKASRTSKPMVKICGTRSAEAAKTAIEAGADLIGMILAPGTKRTVSAETALAISEAVHRTKKPQVSKSGLLADSNSASDFFEHSASRFVSCDDRALLVGVFRNQSLEYVLEQQRLLNLDVVQFHGQEPLEWAKLVPVPVLRAFNPRDHSIGLRSYHALPLLDAGSGGSGQQLDLTDVKEVFAKDDGIKVILAGGLNPDNVQSMLAGLDEYRDRVKAVDVSSGVEEDGQQSLDKIRAFVEAVKS